MTDWLTCEQVAEPLQVDPEAVRTWVRARRLPALVVERVIRIQRTDLEAFLTQYKTKQKTETPRIYPMPRKR